MLIRVDNVRVNSVKQVERLIQKTKGNRYDTYIILESCYHVTTLCDLIGSFCWSSILVTLQRPPPHFSPLALSTQPTRSNTRSGDTAPHTEYTEEWDSECWLVGHSLNYYMCCVV